jgi:hypothetical protein
MTPRTPTGWRARSAALIACSALLTVTAACTTEGAPPQPATTVPTTTTKTQHPTIAPPAIRTLDLTPVWGKPCAPVNQDLLAGMDLSDPPANVSLGRELQLCVWEKDQPSGPRLAIAIERSDPLGEIYRTSNGPRGAYFRPTTVAGMPAVFYSVNSEAQGVCSIVVGTGPEQGITASAGGDHSVDWCVKAMVAAEQVVRYVGG